MAAGTPEDGERDQGEVDGDEDVHRALPAAEAARQGGDEKRERADDHRGQGGHAEHPGGEVDAEELGDQGEPAEEHEVAEGECRPETAETREDEPGVADPAHRPEARRHLLVDEQDGEEEQQHPEQPGAVVLSRLGEGRDAARVVVGHHRDEAGAAHDGERGEPGPPGAAGRPLADRQPSPGAVDVTEVCRVDDRAVGSLDGGGARHRVHLHRPLKG